MPSAERGPHEGPRGTPDTIGWTEPRERPRLWGLNRGPALRRKPPRPATVALGQVNPPPRDPGNAPEAAIAHRSPGSGGQFRRVGRGIPGHPSRGGLDGGGRMAILATRSTHDVSYPTSSTIGPRSGRPRRSTGAARNASTTTIRPSPQAGQAWALGRSSTATCGPGTGSIATGGIAADNRFRHSSSFDRHARLARKP